MPFTLAHPAAVLPLMRRPLDGLALVCGAVAPDFAYFIRSTSLEVSARSWYEPFTNATTTHSVAGLVPTTLLLALGAFLMLRLAARPLAWLTHGRWAVPTVERSGATSDPAGRAVRRHSFRWGAVLVSLLIGAMTHIAWDSMTSSTGFVARYVDALNEPATAGLTWIRLSQHASTVIGLTVIAVVLWRHRRSLLSDEPTIRRRALLVAAGFLAVGLGAAIVSLLADFDPTASSGRSDQIENALSIAAKSAGATVAAAVVAVTAVWWLSLLLFHRNDAAVPTEPAIPSMITTPSVTSPAAPGTRPRPEAEGTAPPE